MKNLKSGLIVCGIIGLVFSIILSIINFRDITINGFFINFITSYLYASVIGLGNGLINNYLNKKWDWLIDTNKRVVYGVIFTLLYTIPAVIFANYLMFNFFGTKDELFSPNMLWIHLFYIILSLGISALLHAKSFIKYWKESSKKEIVKHQVIATDSTSKFETLKNQIDPHFLFNSLNVLSALIEEKPENAIKFTNSLSKIYRYILEEKDKELISISDEIEFAKTYMNLLKMRFENNLHFKIENLKNTDNLYVVPLSLQLLLENTIKHNFASPEFPLIITISQENDYLLITNNLQKKEVETRKGVGIQNIVNRYALLTDKKVEIIETKENFIVKIPIVTEKINIMQNTNQEDLIYLKAQKRLKEIKEFYSNLLSYCFVIPCLIAINLLTNTKFLWFFFPMFGWGFGLLLHAFNTFSYGRNWEEKKIKELMNKN